MIEGIAHLRRAREILAAGQSTEQHLRESVQSAAKEFWSAVFYSDHWPADLQERRDALIRQLLCGTVIEESVRSMDEPKLRAVCHELRALAAGADSLCQVGRKEET